MGKFYKNSIIPEKLRRNFDVYERINQLGINLGKFEENVSNITKAGLPIASVVFHESGLVYLSGQGGGENQMNDDPERVKQGQEAAQKIADNMLTRLHWALKCGNEGGDLNDVLYTVKALGMVVSTDVDFDSGPAVMNGFSLRWQSIFGGLGEVFKNGKPLPSKKTLRNIDRKRPSYVFVAEYTDSYTGKYEDAERWEYGGWNFRCGCEG